MSPPRRDTGGADLLQRVADQTDAIIQRLAHLEAALERRLAPLESMPARVEKIETRLSALEAVEQRAQGAVWLGRALLLALGGAVTWLLNHFTR